jgi:hypothetical protein
MTKDDQYYAQVLAFARESLGSYKAVATAMKAPSGPAVQMWKVNGVAHKWRPVLEKQVWRGLPKVLE